MARLRAILPMVGAARRGGEIELPGWVAAVGVAIHGGVTRHEHWIVRPSDLSRLNAAFFNVNGYISPALLRDLGGIIDPLNHRAN